MVLVAPMPPGSRKLSPGWVTADHEIALACQGYREIVMPQHAAEISMGDQDYGVTTRGNLRITRRLDMIGTSVHHALKPGSDKTQELP